VKKHGELVALTRTEWMLLQHLAANAGKILLNAELLAKVWGPEYGDDLQYLRVWVSRLRRKLEDTPSSPKILRTFQGIGYMFVEGDAATEDDMQPAEEALEAAAV
jgi:two-component system KDP operon response regulator KdpE